MIDQSSAPRKTRKKQDSASYMDSPVIITHTSLTYDIKQCKPTLLQKHNLYKSKLRYLWN